MLMPKAELVATESQPEVHVTIPGPKDQYVALVNTVSRRHRRAAFENQALRDCDIKRAAASEATVQGATGGRMYRIDRIVAPLYADLEIISKTEGKVAKVSDPDARNALGLLAEVLAGYVEAPDARNQLLGYIKASGATTVGQIEKALGDVKLRTYDWNNIELQMKSKMLSRLEAVFDAWAIDFGMVMEEWEALYYPQALADEPLDELRREEEAEMV